MRADRVVVWSGPVLATRLAWMTTVRLAVNHISPRVGLPTVME